MIEAEVNHQVWSHMAVESIRMVNEQLSKRKDDPSAYTASDEITHSLLAASQVLMLEEILLLRELLERMPQRSPAGALVVS
jgi:hypothetical protein